MPKLSIIIPTFNSSGTIDRCLQSIRVQTFTDYEIVVQDGGSSDRTIQLIEEFLRGNPGIKLELEQVSDNGVYDAMNKAMHRASGEWLYFLGSDDELYACDVLGKMVDSSEAADGDVLYGSVLVDGPAVWATDGAIYDGSFDLSKLLSKNICHQAMFFRTSLVRSVGCFNTSYVVCADWDFNMRCWAKGQFKYVDLIVAIFHSGGISTQHQTDPDFESDVTRNVIHYFNLSSDDPLVTSPSFCGKKSNEARRASRVTPRRVLRSLAKRFGSGC